MPQSGLYDQLTAPSGWRPMTLYLHIGTGKTGTTSIQTFLEENRGALRDAGIVVPKSPGRRNHRKLTMYALNDDVVDNSRRSKGLLSLERIEKFRKQFLEEFRNECSLWKDSESVVLSSEQMTRLRREGELERLKALLDIAGRPIKVIVYLRRQDLYFISEYSQLIKGGLVQSLSAEGARINMAIYDYGKLLSVWARAFGKENLVVRPFELGQLKDGDALDDFMALLGFGDLSAFTRPGVRNQSLDAHTVEFLRRINPLVPRWIDGRPNPARAGLVEYLEEISSGPKLRLSRQQAETFLETFRQSNADVARTYLGRGDGRLFHRAPGDDGGVDPSLSIDQAMEISGKIWNHLTSVELARRAAEARGG
jgi:hypothetical protein